MCLWYICDGAKTNSGHSLCVSGACDRVRVCVRVCVGVCARVCMCVGGCTCMRACVRPCECACASDCLSVSQRTVVVFCITVVERVGTMSGYPYVLSFEPLRCAYVGMTH